MTFTWKISSFTSYLPLRCYLPWLDHIKIISNHMLPLVNYYKEHWKVCKEINLMPGTFPLHRLIKREHFSSKLHTIAPQCFGFSHLYNIGIMIRKRACPHMGTNNFIITCLSLSKVGLVEAIAVHVGGKGRVQERFEILFQEPPSDGMRTILPFTEVEVSQDEDCFLPCPHIENFHQA